MTTPRLRPDPETDQHADDRDVIAEWGDDTTGLRVVDNGDGRAEVLRVHGGKPRPYGSLDYTDTTAHVQWNRTAHEEPGYRLELWASWVYSGVGTWRRERS